MQRLILPALVLVLGIALGSSVAFAQTTFPIENHYKVYFTQPNPSVNIHLWLDDQWGITEYTLGEILFNFANPVQKNGSTVYFPDVHHTWWFLPSNTQDPARTVELDNQFGRQTWTVRQAEYLLLPAAKSVPPAAPPEPLPPNAANHYKCYGATGPSVTITVDLVDQFGQTTSVATNPRFFCNPVAKRLDSGEVFPIVDPEAHLACYELQPIIPAFRQLIAVDQFGTWELLAREAQWLCLPTHKLRTVPVQENTWGGLKVLYR